MAKVIKFEKPERSRLKSCQTCRYLHKKGYAKDATDLWMCGICCTYCDFAIRPTGQCGIQRVLWEPRPPSFWSRLGEAIIERVKGHRS